MRAATDEEGWGGGSGGRGDRHRRGRARMNPDNDEERAPQEAGCCS